MDGDGITPLIFEAEAAEHLGVPYRVLRNERLGGRVTYHRVGGRIMYLREHLDEWLANRKQADSAQIYFIQGDKGTPIKIGITGYREAKYRVADLQSGNPYRLRMLCCVPGDLYLEKALHRAFAADRMMGEWFACSPRLLGLIKALRKGVRLFDALTEVVNECPDIDPENSGQFPSRSVNMGAVGHEISTD